GPENGRMPPSDTARQTPYYPGGVPMPKYVHCTELKPCDPDRRGAADWNCYVREVGRLIAESHQGRSVLIHGGGSIRIWDTEKEAVAEGNRRFPSLRPAHQLRVTMPFLTHPLSRIKAAGHPIPPPLSARAILDSGTNVSCVAAGLLQRLGLV